MTSLSCLAFLQKPVNLDALCKVITDAIEGGPERGARRRVSGVSDVALTAAFRNGAFGFVPKPFDFR